MGYKKQRLATKLLHAARNEERYRDIHVFIGGTGAVGATALLQMLSMYEEMMSIRAPRLDDVPVLVATGLRKEDLHAFTHRLFRFVESRHGNSKLPRRVGTGYLTHSGVFVSLVRFELSALPSLEGIQHVSSEDRPDFVRSFLRNLGGMTDPFTALMEAISHMRPISGLLKNYQGRHFRGDSAQKYRSVTIGIPMPSLVAYHLGHLETAAPHIEGLDDEKMESLRQAFRRAFRDDLNEVQSSLADMILVAHTTAVGGMYDEKISEGKVDRTIRLGFAHSAQDTRLVAKQQEAEKFTKEYAQIGIKVLITAAAIGIDEVRIRAKIPLHHQIEQKLRNATEEVFPGAKKTRPSKEGGSPTLVRHFVNIYPPLTVPLDTPPSGSVSFESGKLLCPTYSIRSGENGFFTVANADALYRVMRVASASELGQLLATVGLFGDDELSPWFPGNVCYYAETDNSRQVFDLLSQPQLFQTQVSGLEPLALQDLGSAKHQGELHTLSLLILLHRLRTLNVDAIDPYVDLEHFDAAKFFLEHSRPLTFEDLDGWTVESLAQEMQVLASADAPQSLAVLNLGRHISSLFPLKAKAFNQILECALEAVRMVTSLGSPLLFDLAGKTYVRTGYFVAPLDLLVTKGDSIATWLQKDYAAWLERDYGGTGYRCSPDDYREYHICSGGFVDLRPIAVLCSAKSNAMNLRGKIRRFSDEHSLRLELMRLEPYSFFTTSGLVALLYRLRSLYSLLQEAIPELGTLHEFRWQMPRDLSGHIILVPGVVEAFRMVAEGLEKTTGTERLDGIWGYERRIVPERWDSIPGL